MVDRGDVISVSRDAFCIYGEALNTATVRSVINGFRPQKIIRWCWIIINPGTAVPWDQNQVAELQCSIKLLTYTQGTRHYCAIRFQSPLWCKPFKQTAVLCIHVCWVCACLIDFLLLCKYGIRWIEMSGMYMYINEPHRSNQRIYKVYY